MGDIENASLPSESYYTSDGSTESMTFPRVGHGVSGKRKIVVRCNHPTSLPKIDHVIRLEESTDTVTSSSGSCDPATMSCSSSSGTFGEALAEFGRSELAQALEEEVRNEYLAICKRSMCLPHESKIARYNVSEGILLMVKVFRQMRTIDIKKEALMTSIKYDLLELEFYGFDCTYLNIVFEKMWSLLESFKKHEEEEGELQARIAKVQESCKVLDLCIRRYQSTL
ncbi:hypothetical protein OROHE_004869 [Orobanche hederae]